MPSKPHQDRQRLYELYIEEDLTQKEIADRLDVGDSTISNWVRKFGLNEAKKPPWHDADLLDELYWGEEMSIQSIADELDTSGDVVHRWMKRHDIPRRPGPHTQLVWHNPELLRWLYHERELSQREIAERLGTYQETISKWMLRYGIPTKEFQQAGADAVRVNRAYYTTDPDGYERCGARVGDTTKHTPIHRLVAVAEYGFEEVADKVVHHKNGIKWDNRPDNLEVMADSEHKSLHARGEHDPGDVNAL